jgi:hypothetical protein
MANSRIDGKQCSIAWYIEETKISHVDPKVVTMIIAKIKAVFDKLTITQGKEHTFLGMYVKFVGDMALISTRATS